MYRVITGHRIKGHRKRFPKLVKMLVLHIQINFNHKYIKNVPIHKITVVFKLALLVSHIVETLDENLY